MGWIKMHYLRGLLYTFTMYGILYADSINRGRNVSTNNPASNISASVILSVNL